jgi:hypothetical protein
MKIRTYVVLAGGAVALAVGVYLLFPTLYIDGVKPDTHRTRYQIMRLGTGIDAFKNDFGVYPPSRYTREPQQYKSMGGAGLVVYYLVGPTLKGWGLGVDGRLPLSSATSTMMTYGPYYAFDTNSRPAGLPGPVLDVYKPGKPFLYFRAERGRDPLFDVTDNPVDPTGRTGLASQTHLEMLAGHRTMGGELKWQREDYLLISAGPDGIYGYAIRDETTGEMRPARPAEQSEAECDDVTNFDIGGPREGLP